ncbi:MAG: pyruvate kinase [Bacteroidetes bacterium]|nr:pyruvate kinase [Bacteroidota bacterium]
MIRHTKIVCTIGPATRNEESIERLIDVGMNVARLNFSHGSHQDHKETVDWVRTIAAKKGKAISILMDLQGPKIRVGQMKEGAQKVEAGQELIITSANIEGTSTIIPIDFPELPRDASIGDTILIDDGLLELRVTSKDKAKGELTTEVVVGGLLKSRKGVNLPNVAIQTSPITEKDFEDLKFGLSLGVDFVALSFVRSPREIQEIVSRVRAEGSQAGVIAKIEKPEAIPVIDDIIEESDGIMVARGDLGIEIPSEQVPIIQKLIIDRCRAAGKPVITATQMLDSMISNPRPTRAESSDVANAIMDGTDAVMLSGETAAGEYPFESVAVMDRIARNVEENYPPLYNSLGFKKPDWEEKQVIESVAYSCVSMAENVGAVAIATITHSGSTARRISKFRPNVPIIAFTEEDIVRHQLNLVWGVHCMRVKELFDTDQSITRMEEALKEKGIVEAGQRVIFATGMPISKRGRTNMVMVKTIE